MRRLRPALLVSALLLGLVHAGPASAVGAGAFAGTVTVSCFGCGGSQHGSGDFILVGANGAPIPGGAFHAEFSMLAGTGLDCVLTDHVEGFFTGAVDGPFSWDRLFTFVALTTNGLPGTATFTFVDPIGLPCGTQSLTAAMSGTLLF